jgi:hypothetical protein
MNVRVAALIPCLLALAAPVAAQTIGEIQTKATIGDRQSQFLLGEAYRTGQGVTPDRDQAITWFRKAAAQGDTRAADAMGLLLFTKGDRKEAIPLLEAAEARADPRAFYLLGTARFNGDGVPKDLPRAYAEMRAAADKGLPQAIRSLQLMEPYIGEKDRTASNAIHPGQMPATTTLAAAAPAPQTVAAAPAYAPAPITRPAPAPIQTTAIPPSVPSAPATALLPPPVATPAPTTMATAPAPKPTPVPLATTAALPAAPPARAPKPTPLPATTATPEPTPSTATGKWRVQLGAIATQDKAEAHWQMLVRKLPQLSRLPHTVMQAGAIWRLQATGLSNRAEAQELCTAVAAKGGACIALSPAPTTAP